MSGNKIFKTKIANYINKRITKKVEKFLIKISEKREEIDELKLQTDKKLNEEWLKVVTILRVILLLSFFW
jgi:hypothetical protein